jgi:purine-binding chemotaxis protein CheW
MPDTTDRDVRSEARFLTFEIDERLYALGAEEVAEVIRMPALARVPQAPPSLLGLGNLRGRVAPIASLRALLGGDPARDDLNGRALVLTGPASVAISIDTAPTLVSAERVQTDGAEVAAREGERLLGVFDVGDRVARVLDIKALIAAAFVPRAASQSETRRTGGAAKSAERRNTTEEDQKVISFVVAGQEFALELDAVREVILTPDSVASIPHSEELVLGVTAYRDTLLPLLSLRGLLGLSGAAQSERSKVVVSHIGGALVGLVADQARAIVSVPEGEADPPPSVLAARAGAESRIKAIYRGDGGRRLISILAPDQLFREDVMQRLNNARGTRVDAGSETTSEELRDQFLVFRLGEDEFALPIDAVIEVARLPERITKVPRTPDFLEGVISFRGDILPVVDQRRRFDMPVREGDEGRRIIIVRSERHRAALIVDAVSEVLSNPRGAIDAAPDLTGHQTRLVQGVINLESAGRMVMVLDPVELLSRAERGLLDAFDPSIAAAK